MANNNNKSFQNQLGQAVYRPAGPLRAPDIDQTDFLGAGGDRTSDLPKVQRMQVVGDVRAGLSAARGRNIPDMPFAYISVGENGRILDPEAEETQQAIADGASNAGEGWVDNVFHRGQKKSQIKVMGPQYRKWAQKIASGTAQVDPQAAQQFLQAGWYLGGRYTLSTLGFQNQNGNIISSQTRPSSDQIVASRQGQLLSGDRVRRGALGYSMLVQSHPAEFGFGTGEQANANISRRDRDELGQLGPGGGVQGVNLRNLRGSTRFPLRDQSGNPAPEGYTPYRSSATGRLSSNDAYQCRTSGSGPGITGTSADPKWRFTASTTKTGGVRCTPTHDEYVSTQKQSLNRHSTLGTFAADVAALEQQGVIDENDVRDQDANYQDRVNELRNSGEQVWFGAGQTGIPRNRGRGRARAAAQNV